MLRHLSSALIFLLSSPLLAADLSFHSGAVSLSGLIQKHPIALEIIPKQSAPYWIETAYETVEPREKSFKACGKATTRAGSVFLVCDTYVPENAIVRFERDVKVHSAASEDLGFSSRLTFEEVAPVALTNYDVLVPSVWYRDNVDVRNDSLGSDLTDYHYWFREDRLPLPFIMLRNKSSGKTFSIFHTEQESMTFTGEDGLARIIDERMTFGSLGLFDPKKPSVGFLYPGSEGERTGVTGMKPERRWALRSHPVAESVRHSYKLLIRVTQEKSFPEALRSTWQTFYEIQNPSIYQVNLDLIYGDQIALLNKYWRLTNGSPGVPFAIHVRGEATDYSMNMGFVGQQIANASLLIREGHRKQDQVLKQKGEQIVEWWVQNSLTAASCPRNWYDPHKKTWYGYETYLRVVGDAMSGLLWAWQFEKEAGNPKPEWLETTKKVAGWLQKLQASDGSFPRAVDCPTNTVTQPDKNNTTHIIQFLIDLYVVTKDEAYRTMALRAGEYVFQDVHKSYRYVGGTPDHPNVPDKEAAAMALRAFLALYDVGQDQRWLDAALQSAYYYQTWIYAWHVPIPEDDSQVQFPKSRQTTGLSVVSTGTNNSDTYAAIDAFNFYRLYLYTLDPQLRNIARLTLYNTKQYVNWNAQDPIPNFGDPGLLAEALRVTSPRGHGTPYYIGWQSFNLLEPMIQFEQAFGTFDLKKVEDMDISERQRRNKSYSRTRGF